MRYAFIPGMSRSGTSWVADWLGLHPDVAVFHETYLTRYGHELLHHEPVGGRLVRRSQLRNFLDVVYEEAAKDKSYIVDKSPSELSHRGHPIVDTIFDLYPEGRVLYLYRDGKSFVHGLFHLPWKPRTDWTVEKAVAYWNSEVETMVESLIDAPGDDRVLVVRYEDLVADPTKSREITAFLGLEHHGDVEVWQRPINTVNESYEPDRWQSLDRRSRKLMRAMNPFLERLGYEPVS
jgi:hypothetical protein